MIHKKVICPLYKDTACGAPEYGLESFHWESDKPYRPHCTAGICAVAGKGFFVRFKAFETNPRAVNSAVNSPVYEDSCLEAFLAPVPGRDEYINLEMNSRGVYLLQFGSEREQRVFADTVTDISPSVKPFWGDGFWGLDAFIPNALISALYGIDFDIFPGEIRGNFCKCGDKTETAHYAVLFPVDKLPPGFHNPRCFGIISIENSGGK